MSESQNQKSETSSEETITLNTPEEYLDYTINTTKAALGLLMLEQKAATQSGAMTPTLRVLFDASMVLLSDIQHIAVHRREDVKKPDISVPPPITLTDRFGNPIKGL